MVSRVRESQEPHSVCSDPYRTFNLLYFHFSTLAKTISSALFRYSSSRAYIWESTRYFATLCTKHGGTFALWSLTEEQGGKDTNPKDRDVYVLCMWTYKDVISPISPVAHCRCWLCHYWQETSDESEACVVRSRLQVVSVARTNGAGAAGWCW